jgi:hypothetical protein
MNQSIDQSIKLSINQSLHIRLYIGTTRCWYFLLTKFKCGFVRKNRVRLFISKMKLIEDIKEWSVSKDKCKLQILEMNIFSSVGWKLLVQYLWMDFACAMSVFVWLDFKYAIHISVAVQYMFLLNKFYLFLSVLDGSFAKYLCLMHFTCAIFISVWWNLLVQNLWMGFPEQSICVCWMDFTCTIYVSVG